MRIHLGRILVSSIATGGVFILAIVALLVWSWQRTLVKVLEALPDACRRDLRVRPHETSQNQVDIDLSGLRRGIVLTVIVVAALTAVTRIATAYFARSSQPAKA